VAEAAGGGIFTGERMVAGDPLFAADLSRHLVAYEFARERVRGKVVLDAGCGDGYGAHVLAAGAASVVGIDRSAETIAVARRRYQRPNLRYEVCELDRLEGLGQRFDVVSHFQVIEHLPDPVPFLQQAKTVLSNRDGLLIVTTPNRPNSLVENPYHVREYAGAELRQLLSRVFPRVELLGICGDARAMAYERTRARYAGGVLKLDPLGLRRLVPRPLVEALYPHLARMVRRTIRRTNSAAMSITVENFRIGEDYDNSLDLLALCHV
jgi:SAM-dependent methyltransferase